MPPAIQQPQTGLYYFDGQHGCVRCQAMTGYYPTLPRRPHPQCQCPIYINHLSNPQLITCNITYFNPVVAVHRGGFTYFRRFNNCGLDRNQSWRVVEPLQTSISDNASATLKSETNFSPPSVRNNAAVADIPPNSVSEIEYFVSVEDYSLSVQREEYCSDGTIRPLPPLTGTYSKTVSIVVFDQANSPCRIR